MKKISRRDFLQGSAAGILGTAVTGILGGSMNLAAKASEGELTVVKIVGYNSSRTTADGETHYLRDYINDPNSLRWQRLVSDLAERGVQLEVELIEEDQYETYSQTAFATSLDADMMNISYVSDEMRLNLVENGKFWALDDLIDQYSDGTAKEFFETGDGEMERKMSQLEDGKIYWKQSITIGDYHGAEVGAPLTFAIRYDWLEKLGLDIPNSPDELFDALKAFQDQDVNGTGLADEVASISTASFTNGLAQCFGVGTDYVYVDEAAGVATSAWYDEGVKTYIEYMQRLYQAGLLETSGLDSEKEVENKLSGRYEWTTLSVYEASVQTPEGEPKTYYVPITFEAIEGVTPLVVQQAGFQLKGGDGFAVLADTKVPEAVAALLDYLCSSEYQVLTDWGIEGYNYIVNDDGTKEFIEGTAEDTVDVQLYDMALWALSILPRYEIKDRYEELLSLVSSGIDLGYEEGFTLKGEYIDRVYSGVYGSVNYSIDGVVAVATQEESARITELSVDLATYSSELLSKLIFGQASLDDWDTYIADMQRLGLDEIIEIYQTRYDRAHS